MAPAELDPHVTSSLFWIALAVLAAPLVRRATRAAIPEVVALLGLGILIGPSVLGLAGSDQLGILSELGLGLLFVLAGFEIDTSQLRSPRALRAALTWLCCSAAATAVGLAVGLSPTPAVALGLALTSTALGTLLPILQAAGTAATPMGTTVLMHGVMGELGPVISMALLLSSRTTRQSALVLLAFFLVAVAVALVPRRVLARIPESVRAAMASNRSRSAQTMLRAVMVMLVGLMALAAVLDLDVVLGAFATGIILRRLSGDHHELLERHLRIVGNTFPVPLFFVMSGMAINLATVDPALTAISFAAILLARGVPVWVAETVARRDRLEGPRPRLATALYAAAGLPIIVAVTQVATTSGLMPEAVASSLVLAGALTILVLPQLAGKVAPRPDHAAA